MATINFYQPSTINQKNYLYSDVQLDLEEEVIFLKNKKSKSDIIVNLDAEAIKNSITNLFSTRKGQRPLEPEFGINLEQYLFEPISAMTANRIGNEIKTGLKFEPRVKPLSIDITVMPSEDGYRVDMLLYITALSINTLISANLSRLTGATFN